MIEVLPTYAPGIDPMAVIATGATQIRTMFPADSVTGILMSYMAGIKVAFAIGTASVGFSFVLSLFSDWRRLNAEALKAAGGAA